MSPSPCILQSLAHMTLLSLSIGLSLICVRHVRHESQLYEHV
jgi:hypothetical protein